MPSMLRGQGICWACHIASTGTAPWRLGIDSCRELPSHSVQRLFFGIQFKDQQRTFIPLFNWICLLVPVAELMGNVSEPKREHASCGKDHRLGPRASQPRSCFSFGMVLGSYRQNGVHFMLGVSNMGRTLGTEEEKKLILSLSWQIRADGTIGSHFTPFLDFCSNYIT